MIDGVDEDIPFRSVWSRHVSPVDSLELPAHILYFGWA
jgi:hypothetical protein